METETLKSMIDQIKFMHHNEEGFNVAEYLINHYYFKAYNGVELDYVFEIYFISMWWELTFWLGKNESYCKKHGAYGLSLDKLMTQHLLNAKIISYNRRRNIFLDWKNNKTESSSKNELDNTILNSINMMYSIGDDEDVKRDLDLIVSKDKLETQLKELQRC